MAPVNHGVFWFNGFLPLEPFVAWSPARISPEERTGYLKALEARLVGITSEPPLVLPPLRDFPAYGADSKRRFVVTVSRVKPTDDEYQSLIARDAEAIGELRRRGVVLDMQVTPAGVEPWRCFLHCRETDAAAVQDHLAARPLAPWLSCDVTEVN